MRRWLIIGAIIVLVIAAVWVGYSQWQKIQNQNNAVISEYVDRKLTDEDIKIFEERIVADDKGILDAKNADEKYNWLTDKGTNLSGLGRLTEARIVLEEAVSLKPEFYAARSILIQVLIDMNDNRAAEDAFKSTLKIASGNSNLWRNYIQFKQDRLQASNKEIDSLFREAAEKTQGNVDIIKLYAIWLEQVGDNQKAIENWQKAIVANPGGKDLYQGEINRLNEK